MEIEKESLVLAENKQLESVHLARVVKLDFYTPAGFDAAGAFSLLLINDGQDFGRMNFESLLTDLCEKQAISAVLTIAIHAGPERKMEYGTAGTPDFKGRGAKAESYTRFIFEELIPFVHKSYPLSYIKEKVFAGFSLGGLNALDIVWNHPLEFSKVGVFSGSLWWRSKDQYDPGYDDQTDRIMHQRIRKGVYHRGLKFFFESGQLDEQRDRNQNGLIDSIDDTIDLIFELKAKGYSEEDIEFLLLEDGKHDVETWGKAMPVFLRWAFGK